MKRFALSLTAPLFGALAFVAACTDATSPDSHAALRPEAPTPALQGNIPPPPTRTVVVITVASTPVTGIFTGVYFANGGSPEAASAAAELADEILGWNGTAWLRLDNTQTLGPVNNPNSASANARFQITKGLTTDPNLSGRGTLVILGQRITIDRVTAFVPNPDCFPGALCATIEFDASVNGEPGHHGTVQAFDREVCTTVLVPNGDGNTAIFVCPFGGSGL
jgi:hypothetical protein